MGQKKNIVIVGYPKSGNTWATRLIAQLVGCPVEGFWGSDQFEIATEGEDRISDYRCFKSHHTWEEIHLNGLQPDKIIYIARDPRDICVSGAHYFNRTTPIPSTTRNMFVRIVNKTHWLLLGRNKMIREMIKALLEGNAWVHSWCAVSWAFHLNGYLGKEDVLVLTYSELLDHGEIQAQRVLDFIGIERTPDHIKRTIEAHSFANTKARFEQAGNRAQGQFLRKGAKGEWRSILNERQKNSFADKLGREMKLLGFSED